MNSQTLAHFLDDLGLADFRPTTSGGDCFIDRLPADPDACVVISAFGGDYDTSVDEEVATWQIRTRGVADDAVGPYEAIKAITDALAAADTPLLMAEGTSHEARVILIATSVPSLLGWDNNDRAEWVARVTIRSAPA